MITESICHDFFKLWCCYVVTFHTADRLALLEKFHSSARELTECAPSVPLKILVAQAGHLITRTILGCLFHLEPKSDYQQSGYIDCNRAVVTHDTINGCSLSICEVSGTLQFALFHDKARNARCHLVWKSDRLVHVLLATKHVYPRRSVHLLSWKIQLTFPANSKSKCVPLDHFMLCGRGGVLLCMWFRLSMKRPICKVALLASCRNATGICANSNRLLFKPGYNLGARQLIW